MRAFFGDYSFAAVTLELIAQFRDERLNAGHAANRVRLDLVLLGHLFTVAMQEWSVGLTFDPVELTCKPAPEPTKNAVRLAFMRAHEEEFMQTERTEIFKALLPLMLPRAR